jgi:hypothetical protein
MTDVFVSYSRRDLEIVAQICNGLCSRGKLLGTAPATFDVIPGAIRLKT